MEFNRQCCTQLNLELRIAVQILAFIGTDNEMHKTGLMSMKPEGCPSGIIYYYVFHHPLKANLNFDSYIYI